MPTSEPVGYASGHFNRVYEYIIEPACRQAGFWPERADAPNTYTTASDILKNIIDSDLVICDLSADKTNIRYGLAVREALNLPVVLIKDLKTPSPFTLIDLDQVEYDESLRIDTVPKEVDALSESLKKAYANKAVTNSLLNRLGIGSDQLNTTPSFSFGTFADEPNQPEEYHDHKDAHLPVISPLPEYVGDPITEFDVERLSVGESVFHINYGLGEIKAVRKMAKDKVAEIHFESGAKTLVLGTSGILRSVSFVPSH